MTNDIYTRLVRLHEGQHVEFKVDFPENKEDLAKSIAAFSTSGDGTIFIGVANDGSLLGIANAHTTIGKDETLKRIKGLYRDNVRPSVSPTIQFHTHHDDRTIVEIVIPKGTEPVYYFKERPYVRDGNESRPARPEEVKAIVIRWHTHREQNDEAENRKLTDFLDLIARVHSLTWDIPETEWIPDLDLRRERLGHLADELSVFEEQSVLSHAKPHMPKLVQLLRDIALQELAGDGGVSQNNFVTNVQAAYSLAEAILECFHSERTVAEHSRPDYFQTLLSFLTPLRGRLEAYEQYIEAGEAIAFRDDIVDRGYSVYRMGLLYLVPTASDTPKRLIELGKQMIQTQNMLRETGTGDEFEATIQHALTAVKELETIARKQ